MKKCHGYLTYKQAKFIVISYVQAYREPFKSAESEAVKFFFPLIPIIQECSYADLNALRNLDEIFENFFDFTG
jgi:hypothetical protein